MAYSKTTWQNNVTDIDANNLNKIEQGIYDNSLVLDAVTNKLNPTDTETYKTAELTEGQITDVIGVNDIVIKGQTEQDGTPTPSAPVDVNVVSGSNIVYISNKNLFNPSNIIANTNIDANGNLVDANNFNLYYISVISGEKYTMTRGQSRQWVYAFSKTVPKTGQQISTRVVKTSTIETFTVPDGYNYIVIRQIETSGESINNLMILKGTYTTAPGYVPHQGKELPLDLPVENLFDNIFNQGGLDLGGTGGETSNNARIRSGFIPVKPNTTYTVSNHNSNIYQFGMGLYKSDKTYDSAHKINNGAWNNFPYTFTTQNDTYYVKIAFKNANDTTLSPTGDYKIMLSKELLANAYTPYGTDPIELCKIGNYQDYFYKSGSKWYLHKEIGEVVLDGSESWKLSNNLFVINALSANRHLGGSTVISNLYQYITSTSAIDTTNYGIRTGNAEFVQIKDVDITSVENLKTFLSTNNLIVYYILQTATDTEITGTLKEQLEAIYNAPLYEQTNITQENNDLPMVLDITACKDNINGIKAFIRK